MFKYFWKQFGYEEFPCPKWWMVTPRSGYYRHVRTKQEMTRWYRDKEDGVKLRRRRNPHSLEPWGMLEGVPSCYTTKSWKKLYKKRKQYLKNSK